MSEKRDILKRFAGLRMAVWGDLVADEFVEGEIARVSREAPVLILKHRRSTIVPGGGANAAVNLAALGARVEAIGAVGDDAVGAQLRTALEDAGVNLRGVTTVAGRVTPTKTRVLAHHAHTAPQQVVRLDREPGTLAPDAQARLASRALAAAKRSAALLISDYGYGAASPAAAAAVRRAAPKTAISVDARYQIGGYHRLTAATPNEAELEAAMGVQIRGQAFRLRRAGQRLRERLACRYLLVTRGRDGMALFEAGRPMRALAVHGSDQALDVTGAGDTVIAVFTAALAAGATGLEAAELANMAGGLVVMKRGTATVSAAELAAELARN